MKKQKTTGLYPVTLAIIILCLIGAPISIAMESAQEKRSTDWQRIYIGGGSMKRLLFDVDSDGYNDSMTVANWYKNPGNESGRWASHSIGNSDYPSAGCDRTGDINGDDLPDFVIGVGRGYPTPDRNRVYAFINPGTTGTWARYHIGTLPDAPDGVETVAIGDMNNDGYPDILAGGECKELRWYINPGYMTNNWSYHIVHTFTRICRTFPTGTGCGTPDVEGMVVKDFDNDGYQDVAVTVCSPVGFAGGTYVLINPQTEVEDWELVGPIDADPNPNYSCTESIAAGDINGDGWNDVALASFVDRKLHWYENPKGEGGWMEYEIDYLNAYGYPGVADIDLDDDADVICYNHNDGVTYWYESGNNGTSLEKHRIYTGSISHNGIGDVDNDGDPDIIAGGYWYINPNKNLMPCGCTLNHTLKRYKMDICEDTRICNSSLCSADAACDGKQIGIACGTYKKCNETCKCTPVPPSVISFSPNIQTFNFQNTTRKFIITLDQLANVTWQINGTTVQTNTTVLNTSYTNTSALNGTWNVSALVTNTQGGTIHTWNWTVSTNCFIATATYGTPLHDDIAVLRKVRDDYLMKSNMGKVLVEIYYDTSPPIAELLTANENARAIVRVLIIKPIVEVSKRIVSE